MNEYLAIIFRSSAVYFLWVVALNDFGKELSQLNTADVILILLISNLFKMQIVGNDTIKVFSSGVSIYLALILF
jgi:uncharacterized membrane protein YcaP (DUF421 family)